MATSSKILTLCFITTLIFFSSYGVVASVDHEHQLVVGWGVLPTTRSECRGTIAECLADDEEFGLNSEVSRRILASTRYISYGVLQRNTVPCSRRGASYYNCRSGAQANPYSPLVLERKMTEEACNGGLCSLGLGWALSLVKREEQPKQGAAL
ncbi:hypothetical protein TEA_022067 [Camellia sinensis var. sinensis]|uniref:Rapid alkalinization factor 1 n=1 Tax=Camellia sinensis var. sinensis TaxID=542762 RepID=A0A4S4E3F5_CAMSN|nr:hypothetical protein TEA_022067 [Camellia sinensis var. sinensis]